MSTVSMWAFYLGIQFCRLHATKGSLWFNFQCENDTSNVKTKFSLKSLQKACEESKKFLQSLFRKL